MPRVQQAPIGVFPTPGRRYDPDEESQYRLSVQRTVQEVVGYLTEPSTGTPGALGAGDNNNYSIGPFLDFVRLSANVSGSAITGIADGRTNRRLVIVNLANTLTLEHEDTASSAKNRIITATGAAVSVGANNVTELIYDDVSARWRLGPIVVVAAGVFATVTLTQPSQNYLFTAAGSKLALQSQTAGQTGGLYLFTKDGDGTDSFNFRIYAKGTPSSFTTNVERLNFKYKSSGAIFELMTSATGTGTVRPLRIYTGANTTQIVLNTDGSVSFSGDIGAGVVATTTSFGSFGAATTAKSSMNAPHGSAPTSPVDGDIWTTTAGIFVRINGTTVGPLS